MTEAPRIVTDRLVLRPHRAEDFEAFVEFFASDRARHVGGYGSPRARLWYGFAADVGSWPLIGFGGWAIEERATGALAGQVALGKPDHFPERELGWLLFDGFEGRGYAFEAARAARDFAFATLGWDAAVSYIDPANARSIALARRLGAVEDRDAARLDPDDVVYRHRAPDAAAMLATEHVLAGTAGRNPHPEERR